MEKEIRVKLKPPGFDNPRAYFDFVEKELLAVGVPIKGEIILRGTLTRLDDPCDFGGEEWVWVPNGLNSGTAEGGHAGMEG